LVFLGRLGISTYKTCDGGVQENLISLKRTTPSKGRSVGGYFKTQDYWEPIFFDGTNTIKMFFAKKLTTIIFSKRLTAVRYREIIQQFLEQLHDDDRVPTKI
jgi:hypothetical protein